MSPVSVVEGWRQFGEELRGRTRDLLDFGRAQDAVQPQVPVVLGPDGQPVGAGGDGGSRTPGKSLAKGDPFASTGGGVVRQGTSSTSPGYNLGAGVGGSYYTGPAPRAPITTPLGLGHGRSTFAAYKGPRDTILTSLDGKLSLSLETILFYVRIGQASRHRLDKEHGFLEVFDCTTIEGPSAIFPLLQGPTTSSTKGGASAPAGGGSGGKGYAPYTPPAGGTTPAVYGTTSSTGGKAGPIEVKPPTQPTPGERAIVAAIREEFRATRAQARSDGGTGLRAQGLTG